MTADDAARPPEVIRRREVRHTSARSLLMTVLGEFVLPAGRPVWTWMLVDTLAGFGVTEKSARQALARAAAEGLLVSERVGRRTRWELTPSARRLLSEGARRIYEFGRSERPWDARWLLLLVSVPESKRDLRHRLRTRLSWAGFGSPEAGVWISPHLGREDEALGCRQGTRSRRVRDVVHRGLRPHWPAGRDGEPGVGPDWSMSGGASHSSPRNSPEPCYLRHGMGPRQLSCSTESMRSGNRRPPTAGTR